MGINKTLRGGKPRASRKRTHPWRRYAGPLAVVAVLLIVLFNQQIAGWINIFGSQASTGSGGLTPDEALSETKVEELSGIVRAGSSPCEPDRQDGQCGGLEEGNPNVLYSTQVITSSYLLYASAHMEKPLGQRDVKLLSIIDKLSRIYVTAFETEYKRKGRDEVLQQEYKSWVCTEICPLASPSYHPGKEILLSSAQYAFGATRLMRLISQVPVDQRTATMNELLSKGGEIGADYVRWIKGEYKDRIASQYYTGPAPVWINDVIPQIGAGIQELLRAKQNAPTAFTLDAASQGVISTYSNKVFNDYIVSRGQFSKPAGEKERWVWNKSLTIRAIPTNFFCATYTSAKAPANAQQCLDADPTGQKFAMDISHYARIPDSLESYRLQPTTKQMAERLLRGTAQQMLKVIWNGGAGTNAWKNFADGTNGWFGAEFIPRYPKCEPNCAKTKLVESTSGFAGPSRLAADHPALLARYLYLMKYDFDMVKMEQAVRKAFSSYYVVKPGYDKNRMRKLNMIPMQAQFLLGSSVLSSVAIEPQSPKLKCFKPYSLHVSALDQYGQPMLDFGSAVTQWTAQKNTPINLSFEEDRSGGTGSYFVKVTPTCSPGVKPETPVRVDYEVTHGYVSQREQLVFKVSAQ